MPVASDFVYPVGDPRVAPTWGPGPNGFEISQMFNNSCNPADNQGYYWAGQYFCGHTGVDLTDLQQGDPVHATANGYVVFAGWKDGFGEMVRIQHLMPDGSYMYSQYEHMLYGSLLVATGSFATIDQSIGAVGSTGNSTGAHLHFEIKSVDEDGVGYTFGNDALIVGYDDPLPFIAAHTTYVPPTATPPPPTDTPIPPVSTPVPVATAAPTLAVSATTPPSGSAAANNGGEQQAVLNAFYKQYAAYVTVTGDGLRVRAGWNYTYKPLNSVGSGARLGYLGMTENGWVHVALPGNVTGYVVRQYVTGGPLPDLPPIVAGAIPRGINELVLDARSPARSGPGVRYPAIEALRDGENLVLLHRHVSWDDVLLPTGREGWVFRWYTSNPALPAHTVPTVTQRAPTPKKTRPATKTARTAPPRATSPRATSPRATSPRATSPRATIARAATTRGTPANDVSVAHTVTTRKTTSAVVPGPFVVTIVDGARLRRGPRLGAAKIETLPQGIRLGLRGFHVSWAAVTTPDGTQGYVLARFVSPVTAGMETRAAGTAGTAVARGRVTALAHGARRVQAQTAHRVTTTRTLRSSHREAYLVVVVDGANLRAEPDKASVAVGMAGHDARLILRGTQGNWAYVQTERGMRGWVRLDLTRRA